MKDAPETRDGASDANVASSTSAASVDPPGKTEAESATPTVPMSGDGGSSPALGLGGAGRAVVSEAEAKAARKLLLLDNGPPPPSVVPSAVRSASTSSQRLQPVPPPPLQSSSPPSSSTPQSSGPLVQPSTTGVLWQRSGDSSSSLPTPTILWERQLAPPPLPPLPPQSEPPNAKAGAQGPGWWTFRLRWQPPFSPKGLELTPRGSSAPPPPVPPPSMFGPPRFREPLSDARSAPSPASPTTAPRSRSRPLPSAISPPSPDPSGRQQVPQSAAAAADPRLQVPPDPWLMMRGDDVLGRASEPSSHQSSTGLPIDDIMRGSNAGESPSALSDPEQGQEDGGRKGGASGVTKAYPPPASPWDAPSAQPQA